MQRVCFVTGKTSSFFSTSAMIQFAMMCFCGTFNTSIPSINLQGKHSCKKIFTVHKGMGGKTSPGEGDQRFEVLWTLKSMIFHLVNQGPSWLFYGWQTEVSWLMQTHRNVLVPTYINIFPSTWDRIYNIPKGV